MKYNLICLGGTFDLLHCGHKALIDRAFLVGEKVTIGVVTDGNSKLTYQKKQERIKELIDYLRNKNYLDRVEIVEISDIYGPTITNPDFEAIVVSEETVLGAQEINRVRKERGFKPLEIIVVPMVRDENGEVISSQRIRNGEIDREGRVYKNLFKKTIVISKKARQELKKPQGEIISGSIKYKVLNMKYRNSGLVILVGDLATKRFCRAEYKFDIAVIDLRVERKQRKLFSDKFLEKNVKWLVENKAGTISKELAEAVDYPLHLRGVSPLTPWVIRVIGEEDLAAVPAVLLSPLGTLVFYGQPKNGLVKVEVTEKIKEKLVNLISAN